MTWERLTPLVTVGSIALFFALGAIAPRNPPAVRWSDLRANVLTGAGLYAVRLALQIGVAAPIAALGGGIIPLDAVRAPILQTLVALVLLDFTRYWVHRADHRVGLLWNFHRVHHSTEHLDSTAGLRMHVFDLIQLTAIPIVLFGLLFDASSFAAPAIPIALSVGGFFDAFEHANLRFTLRSPIARAWHAVFNNPLFHSWHHTRDGVKKDGNYGQTLTIWDRLFGSDVTESEPPELYGLDDSQTLQAGPLAMQLLRPRRR